MSKEHYGPLGCVTTKPLTEHYVEHHIDDPNAEQGGNPNYIAFRPAGTVIYQAGNISFSDLDRDAAVREAALRNAEKKAAEIPTDSPNKEPGNKIYGYDDLSLPEQTALGDFVQVFDAKANAVLDPLIDGLYAEAGEGELDADLAQLTDLTLGLADNSAEPEYYTELIKKGWKYSRDHYYPALEGKKKHTYDLPKTQAQRESNPDGLDAVQGIESRVLVLTTFEKEHAQRGTLPSSPQSGKFQIAEYINNAPGGNPEPPAVLHPSHNAAVQKIYAFLQLTPKDQAAHPFLRAVWQHSTQIDADVLAVGFLKHFGLSDKTCAFLTGKTKAEVDGSKARFVRGAGLESFAREGQWKVIRDMFDTVIAIRPPRVEIDESRYDEAPQREPIQASTTPITDSLVTLAQTPTQNLFEASPASQNKSRELKHARTELAEKEAREVVTQFNERMKHEFRALVFQV